MSFKVRFVCSVSWTDLCHLSSITPADHLGGHGETILFYHPHTEYGESNVFTGVCQFTGGLLCEGVYLPTMQREGRHPPPSRQTPPPPTRYGQLAGCTPVGCILVPLSFSAPIMYELANISRSIECRFYIAEIQDTRGNNTAVQGGRKIRLLIRQGLFYSSKCRGADSSFFKTR